jgi:hypothetical protein
LLGLQPDSENRAAKELTTNVEALRKLQNFVDDLTDQAFFAQGGFSVARILLFIFAYRRAEDQTRRNYYRMLCKRLRRKQKS